MIGINPENPCATPILGSIACNPIWAGPAGWFEKAAVSAAQAMFGFAMSLLSWIWGLIQDVTRPQTDASFIYEWASRVFGISLPIIVMFLVFQISMIALRTRTTEGMGKAVAMAAVAVLGTAASVPVVHLLTSSVDGLADDLTVITFGDIQNLGDRFSSAIGVTASFADGVLSPDIMTVLGAGSVIAGAVGFIIFGIFLVLGSVAVFGALLIRTMLLYITIVMGPLAIMGLAWEKTRSWFKIWAGVTITLILSKLAIMIVFGLGVTVLESLSFQQDGAGIAGALLTGSLILLVAALMPVATFKFINFIGDEASAGAMHGGAEAGAARAGGIAQRSSPAQIMKAKQAGGQGGSSGSGGTSSPGSRGTPSPAQSAAEQGSSARGGRTSAGSSAGSGNSGGRAGGGRSGGTAGSSSGLGWPSAPAAGGAAAGAAVVVGQAVKGGDGAARAAADQQSQTAPGAGRTGPDLTRPSQ